MCADESWSHFEGQQTCADGHRGGTGLCVLTRQLEEHSNLTVTQPSEIAPLFKADSVTPSFYATKDGKISVSYQGWDARSLSRAKDTELHLWRHRCGPEISSSSTICQRHKRDGLHDTPRLVCGGSSVSARSSARACRMI